MPTPYMRDANTRDAGLQEVDMVLVGAAGVCESGGVINKMGSFQVRRSDCAKPPGGNRASERGREGCGVKAGIDAYAAVWGVIGCEMFTVPNALHVLVC